MCRVAILVGLSLIVASTAEMSSGRVSAQEGRGNVSLMRVPNGGIQPQVVRSSNGTIHLIYFKGEPIAGDIFYVRQNIGQERFTEPVRVNSQPGSAIATGTIRGGQIALGKGDRVHIAWNGSGKAKTATGSPMLYTRLNESGSAFEEQRNLMQDTAVLDGGGTVAADSSGNVYVAWHAIKAKGDSGEDARQVWLARSADEGKTFSKETPAWVEPTGVCACCSMRALTDSKGSLYALYRSATAGVNRDIYLLSSNQKGDAFTGGLIHKWKIPG